MERTDRSTIELVLTPEQRARVKRVIGQEVGALALPREALEESTGAPVVPVIPNAEFFTRFGIYVARHFLDSELCARLQSEVRSASGSPGEVVRSDATQAVDESARKTTTAHVGASTVALVEARLQALKPVLESYFDVAAAGWQNPHFLVYREGDFLRPHEDAGVVKQRRVSAVIFLNGEGPGADAYSGGCLTFYGLSSDRRFEQYGFPVAGEPGLLVAFRPGVLHGVTPVTRGERHTIVNWLVA